MESTRITGIEMKKNRIGVLLAVLLMSVLIQEESANAQQHGSRKVVWSNTFDTPESIGRIRKVGGSPSTDNVLEIVNEGIKPGNKSFRISFTPGMGDSWYVQFLVRQRIDPGQLLKIAGAMKYSCAAEVNVYFTLCYNSYSDAGYTKRLGMRRSRVTKGISKRDVWEPILDEPFNLKQRSLELGLSDPYQELVLLELKVLNLPAGDRISIWVDDLSIEHADQEDIKACEKSIQVAYNPKPYKSQIDNFYYGYFGGVHGGGFPRYHTQHNLIPVDKRALVNIEFMLKGNFNHVVGGVVFPDGENVDLLTRNIALLNDYGVYTTPIVPINPFYNRPGRGSEATTYQVAERLLRRIIPALGGTPGTNGYILIDEPLPSRKTMDVWIWGKKLYRELDPNNPASGPMNTPDRVRYYTQTEHTVWIDEYPIRGHHYDSYGEFPGNLFKLEHINKLAFELGARQIWNTNQVNGSVKPRRKGGIQGRLASPAEHRLCNYISLASGGRSINYYMSSPVIKLTMGGAANPRLMTVSGYGFGSSVGAEVHPVGKEVIKQGEVVPVYGPVLLGTYWEHERKLPITCKQLTFGTPFDKAAIGASYNKGKDYDVVVVYNRDSLGAQSGTVDLSAVVKGRPVYDLYAGKEVALSNGLLTTGTLAEGDGKMYLIADDTAAKKVADGITCRQHTLLKRKFDFYYREQRHNKMDMAGLASAFEKNQADVKSNPGKALAELKPAFTQLKAREEGTTPFARSHALLKKAQASYVEIVERQAHYWSYVAVDEDPNELVRVPGYMDWEKETRQLSDAYILLRNALYFGHAEKVLPLAEQLAPKVAAMAQAVKRDQYQPVNARAVDLLHKKATALNDFDLIKALRDNMK